MAVIHISETDAAGNLPSLLANVREGAEVIIESGAQPIAILRSAAPQRRSLSESIAIAEVISRELGHTPVMDLAFAADMEEVVRRRKPADRSAWD